MRWRGGLAENEEAGRNKSYYACLVMGL